MVRRALAVLAFIAAACSDSTGPTSGLNGIVSLTFTGAGDGTFYVAARAPNTGEEPDPNSSLTLGLSDDTLVLAGAFKALGNGHGDGVVLGLNRATVGSAPISSDCDIESSQACAALILVRAFDTESETMSFNCSLSAGTIEITQITKSRIVGSFSGTGECLDASDVATPFTVTGGTFNVARLATDPT